MTEPIVGNPKEMAEAIAKALTLVREYQERDHSRSFGGPYIDALQDALGDAEETIQTIEEALENYNED